MPGITFVDIIFRILIARGLDVTGLALRDILFTEPVSTAEDLDREIMVTIGAEVRTTRSVTVVSRAVRAGQPHGSWKQNLAAELVVSQPAEAPCLDIASMMAAAEVVRDMAELYDQASRENIVHLPPMQCFGRLFIGSQGLLAELDIDPSSRDFDEKFYLHPARLDASTLVAFAQTPILDAPFIPISLSLARAPRPLKGKCYVHVPRIEQLAPSGDVMHNSYCLYDATGQLAAEFTRLTCKRIRSADLITGLLNGSVGQPASQAKNATPILSRRTAQDVSIADDGVAALKARLRAMIGAALDVDPNEIDSTEGFYELGLESVAMLRISRELEAVVGSHLYPTLLFEFHNIDELAVHLAKTYGCPAPSASVHPVRDSPSDGSGDPIALQSFRRVWREFPAVDSSATPGEKAVLLRFEESIASDVTPALFDFGYEVVPVSIERGSNPGSSQHRWCDVYNADDVREMLNETAVAGSGPDAFIVLAPLNTGRIGDSYAHDAFRSLASAIVQRRPVRPVRLYFVASGNHNGEVSPEHAAIAALARTISAETPVLVCRSIVVEGAIAAPGLAALLARELATNDEQAEVRYRGGRREVPELQRIVLDDARPVPLKQGGVYLLAGGGGSLGKLLAGYLVERYRARLLLVGRQTPDASLRDHLADLRARGAEAEYLRADITNLEDVHAAVRRAKQLYGQLDGVFNLAGRIDDAVFFRKDISRTESILAPKLRGTLNLDLATRNEPIEIFVLFSSLSAVVPNRGQSDYAYANAFLDHFACQAREQGRRPYGPIAIAWPYWAEGGMRPARAGATPEQGDGLDPLPTEAALGAIAGVLSAGEPHVVLAYGDVTRVEQRLGVRAASLSGSSDDVRPSRLQDTARQTEDIAIIGFAGRYPSAPDIPTFWKNLAEGRDSITEVPPARWNHQRFFDPRRGKRGKTYSRWGGFLDGIDLFAPSFFSISRRDAERMDPQERLFLQTAWHALEDAGHPPETLKGERVGVFAGVMWNHYQLVESDDGVAPLALHSSVPNRVSYCFGLSGPSIAVDTACSSSLVAIHLAIESIRNGDASLALAGGVNATVHPQKYLQLADDQFLSDDGRCRAFGSGGTGYVPGEGVGVVVLKPLGRALADGDHIDAVIKGSFVNHNGSTSGYTVPDSGAQADLVKEAIRRSGVPISSISHIEAHGTGTSLGDPIEIEGLKKAFHDARLPAGSCAIGSVKSNIGHLESAAGIAGVTKVLLEMRHRELVPSLHAKALNSHIDLTSSPFFVQRQREPWRTRNGFPLRAGVSAFGAGGTNAHLILESHDQVRKQADTSPQLVVLSAPDMDALGKLARSLMDHLTPLLVGNDAVVGSLRIRMAEIAGVAAEEIDVDAALFDVGLDNVATAVGQVLPQIEAADVLSDPNMSIRDLARIAADALLPALADVAFTLQVGRRALKARLALVTANLSDLHAGLQRFLKDGQVNEFGSVGLVSAEGRPDPECVDLYRQGQLHEVARRWAGGAKVDWSLCQAGSNGSAGPPRRVSLPVTPLAEERCWIGNWWNGKAPGEPAADTDSRPVQLQFLQSGIAVVTMRDSANGNMLTDAMLHHLEASFAEISKRQDVSVVVLTGTEQLFCTGGTPAALEAIAARQRAFTDAAFVYEGLLRCNCPVIAAMQGLAAGGGLAFGLYAELVVMSTEGSYSADFLKYGFTPGMGASYILEHRFGAALAAEMLLTGRIYSGAELERRGAQVAFEAPAEVLPRALNMARSIAAMPAEAVKLYKMELARRRFEQISGVIAGEAALHDRVLGDEALARVRNRLSCFADHSTGEPAGDSAAAVRDGVVIVTTPVPAGIDSDQVVDLVERALCAQLYADSGELDRDRSFREMGLDSIGAVEVVRDLNQALDLDLDLIVIYDHPTIRSLTAHIVQMKAEQRALHSAVINAKEPAATSSIAGGKPVIALRPAAETVRRSSGGDRPARIKLPQVARAEHLRPAASPTAETSADPPLRPSGDIAVVGMSGSFPDAPDLDAFWMNLAKGKSSIREIPASRWDVAPVFDPKIYTDGKTYSRWAAMLGDVQGFDHQFFNLSPLEAQEMDPQQRLVLMEAWRALEDAGYAGSSAERKRCGVFIGCAAGDYAQLLEEVGRVDSAQAFLGNSASILAARIAYFLDFRGPALAVDTACSSSLVAVHLASESLRRGEIDMALTGGVALMVTPSLQIRSSRVGMLSPTGTCAPFDATADGIVLGEGVGIVVLKRLADAIRDRDHIHGIIKATGMNGDGKTNGITAPSANAQADLLRRVHAEAAIPQRDITYVEAHGTGTAVGDPIEFKALKQVFETNCNDGKCCGLGSVKGNIGHTTMTAGVAGLLKVLLAMRHRQLPPLAGFSTPNPKIDLAGSPFFIARELQDWESGPSGRRLAAVSSFGFSGTNCHLVVAEPPILSGPENAAALNRRAELIPVSGRTEEELNTQLRRLAGALTPEHNLGDVAFTLCLGRRHLAMRAAIVTDDVGDLVLKLRALASGTTPLGSWRSSTSDLSVDARGAGRIRPAAESADLFEAAAAFVVGREPDWESMFSGCPVRRLPLPSYAFTCSPHWISTSAKRDAVEDAVQRWSSVQVVTDGDGGGSGQVMRILADPEQPLYADHRVGGRPILAGATSIAFVIAAAQARGCKLPARVSGVRWLRPLDLDGPTSVRIAFTEVPGGCTYTIGVELERHSVGRFEQLSASPAPIDLAAVRARCLRHHDVAELYRGFDLAGLCYGPSFRLLRSVQVGEGEAVAALASAEGGLPFAGAVLDAGFQAIAALVDDDDDPTPLIPVGVETVDVHAKLEKATHTVARCRGRYLYDVDVIDSAGQILACVRGLMLRPGDKLDGKVFSPAWRPAPPPRQLATQRVAVVYRANNKRLADALNRNLVARETFMVSYQTVSDLDLSLLDHSCDTIYLLACAGPSAGPPERDESAAVLLSIVNALVRAGRESRPIIVKVVVDGAVSVGCDDAVRPHTAALIGLTRTAAAEHPNWRVGCLDVGMATNDLDDVARKIVSEDATERLVVFRGQRRLVRGFELTRLPPCRASPFRQRGRYLVLGGAGGIGTALSLHLARAVQARLVWIGRGAPENPQIRERIAAVAAAGGEVVYLRADAADAGQMTAAVEEARRRLGRIDGVFHVAGVLRDRLLKNMNPADLELVLAAKVAGSVNLHRALGDEPLDFIAFFSSAAALIDSAGQGNYAAASTFEDAYAGYLRHAGLAATVINWGYWGSIGLAANDYHRRLLAGDGIGSLEPAVAFAALERALAAGVEQVLVIEATAAGLEHFGIQAAAQVSAPQNAYQDRSSSRERADGVAVDGPKMTARAASAIEPFLVASYVKRIFAEVLKFHEEELDATETFDRFGVDSVLGGTILGRLEQDLGSLPSTLLFEETTLDRLAKRLTSDRSSELAFLLKKEVSSIPATRPVMEVKELPRPPDDADVAVIGVSGRYPGAPDLDVFWRNLTAGISSIREVPAERWDWRRYQAGGPQKPGPQSWGGFMEGVDMFDAALFGVLPRDAANIDPQERLFLEVCWTLLESAGYLGLSHEPGTGVFAGLMYGTYGEMAAQLWERGELAGAHSAYWSVANRVSYTFDLQGPSFAVDSACSSSLTAVHLACESIRRGDCRMAIAGGVNLILHPAHLASLAARNMLASDGVAKVFDVDADGYVPGEGVGAVLLKPLAAAVADGDEIWAVIKAGSLNAGGRTSGYTVPNPNAQAALVRAALDRARIDPRTVSYLEAHGTGTKLGDPIEIAGLARVYSSEDRSPVRCAIGSVKSNIGHLEGAAGIAGLTKVLLQIRHKQLVPTLNLVSLNPKIELRGTPFEPQRSLSEWSRPVVDLGEGEQSWPLRAGVSSFGAGGANAHLIVEEWARLRSERPTQQQMSRPAHLFLLSAPTEERLLAYAEAVAVFLSSAPADLRLDDLAYTSLVGRRVFEHRFAVIAEDFSEIIDDLRAFCRGAQARAAVPASSMSSWMKTSELGDTAFVDGLVRQRDLRGLAQRWTSGATVDWRMLWTTPGARRVFFPGIPLQRKRFWIKLPEMPGLLEQRAVVSEPAPTASKTDLGEAAGRRTNIVYERAVWKPSPLVAATRQIRSVLLSAPGPIGEAIGEALTDRGIDYLVAPDDELDAFVREAVRSGSLPDAIVHLGAGEVSCSETDGRPDGAFRKVLQMVAAMQSAGQRSGLRVLCARVAQEGREQPHLVALIGLVKTLTQENGLCSGACVAIEPATPVVQAQRIVDELFADGTFEVAYRGGRRLAKAMVPFDPPSVETDYVSAEGSYIITGGAGALGLHFANLLAERGAGDIVLIGRAALSDRVSARIAAIASQGTRICYERADVANFDEIARVVARLRREGQTLRGIIHAAAVIRDAAIVNKTAEQIDAVLASKVAGTMNLDRATVAEPLDFFVLFSSVVGQTGNRGQADYAFANAFLDAFAESRTRWRTNGARSGRTLSIGWPLWRDGGMRIDEAAAARLEARWGMVPMNTLSGLAAFEALLAGTELVATVVETIENAGAAIESNQGNLFVTKDEPTPTIPLAGAARPTSNTEEVADRLRSLAAEFLVVESSEVDMRTSLLDMGFDSISTTDLLTRINQAFGLELLPTVIFECPTLTELASYIARQLEAMLGTRVRMAELSESADNSRQPVSQSTVAHSASLPPGAAARAADDIAVIGMAGVLPGSANLEEFWLHLAAGDHLVRKVPHDREDLLSDRRTSNLVAGFIDGVAEFDAELFAIAPSEAVLMDPQQRLFLQAAWRAIADAGYGASDFRGSRTGVFVGVSTSDYNDLLTSRDIPVEAHLATGLSHAIIANRVSHIFGLRGPSEAIDTACSSSLVALHRAVRALRSGECDAAIVGGVSVALTPGLFVAFAKSGMLSVDGRCKTFDRSADGYVRGEGVGAVVLKRFNHALADGDNILALIKGSAVNHGGRAASLTAPNPQAQAEVLRAAYADAGVNPSTISYLEAHGTGTRLGDPIEIEGIKAVFGATEGNTTAIGSVKTNIGHLEAAAGIAGLLKVLLSMRHGYLPPHLHLTELNPHIKLEGTPLYVNDKLIPWPKSFPRRAGISSFGFGGTNAHVIVEAAELPRESANTCKGPLIFVLSAPSVRRLNIYAEALAARLQGDDTVELCSVAYTLQIGREARRERLAVVSTDRAEVMSALRAAARDESCVGLYRGTAVPGIAVPADGKDALAAAWVRGADIDWRAKWTSPPARISLPTFPFERTPYWLAPPQLPSAAIQQKIVEAGPPAPPNQRMWTEPGSGDRIDEPDSVRGRRELAQIAREHLGTILRISPEDIPDDQPFENLGLDSIFAMDVAERLSAVLGFEVHATALHDHGTIEALTSFLMSATPTLVAAATPSIARPTAAEHLISAEAPVEQPGGDRSDRLRPPENCLEAPAPVRPPRVGTAPKVIPKTQISKGSPLAQLMSRLAREHGLENSLAGRDIAPLLFLGSDRQSYLDFAERGDAVLAWSYTGPQEAFGRLIDEFVTHFRSAGLRVNILSPARIDDAGGIAFTATPFGVMQQIDDLAGFSLDGPDKKRLRNKISRFSGPNGCSCTVKEYVPGTDAAVDRELVCLVDQWAAGKSMVSSYVDAVREDFRRGCLAPEHRVFLTEVGGSLQVAVVATRMPSEAGYLLDVEFYRQEMAAGAVDYSILRIIEMLRAEHVKILSLGATFGVRICESPNASAKVERELEQLRSAGILGTGNYQFKRKFGPREQPIYLCQPIDNRTNVRDILLMIAGRKLPHVEPAAPGSSALKRPPSALIRRSTMEHVEWNPLRLAHCEVEIDLLTDSWAEREDSWVVERTRRQIERQATVPTDEFVDQSWLPFTFAMPTSSGRAAEALLCRAWHGRRGKVLHNNVFPTWTFSLLDRGFKPVVVTCAEDDKAQFKGDVNLSDLKRMLANEQEQVSFIAIELSNNSSGGHPISLGNLRQIRALAEAYGTLLVLDATRIVENAVSIVEHEPGQAGRDPWEVVRELLTLADAAVLSLSKDFGVNFGGLVASRVPHLNDRLRAEVRLRGSDVSLSGRRQLQQALSDTTVVLGLVRERMTAVQMLWKRLADANLPVVSPAGGHCVLLDVGGIPSFTGFAHPSPACLAWMYQHTGIRGGPHQVWAGSNKSLRNCIRLAIPLGMDRMEADRAGHSLVALFQGADRPCDLAPISGSSSEPEQAGYRPDAHMPELAVANPGDWFAKQLGELEETLQTDTYRPTDQNLQVVRAFAPAADCRVVTVPEGRVEIFTIGAGPTLLLMHPFNIGAGMFAPQLAGLSDRFRLIVIHQPGVGRTAVSVDLSLEGLATLQRSVLREMGVNEPVHIGGASMGAIVAQYFALRFPDHTRSLSLIGGSYRFANRKGRIDKLERVVAEDFDAILSATASPRIARHRERLAALLLKCESMDPRTGLLYLELFSKQPELTGQLKDIAAPTLVLQGRHDSVVGVKTGHFMHGAIPDSRYFELPESGHFICFTEPDAVNRELAAFIDGVEQENLQRVSSYTGPLAAE